MARAANKQPPPALPHTEARDRIAHASFRLFGQRGYSCTSIQDIADAAGVQKSVLYYYFESKEDLYRTLLHESSAHLASQLDQCLSQCGEQDDTAARLSLLIESILSLARDHRDPVRFFMAHIYAPDADRPIVDIHATERVTVTHLQQILQRGQLLHEVGPDLEELTLLFLGTLQVLVTSHLRSPALAPIPQGLGTRIVAALFRGATPRQPPPAVPHTAHKKSSQRPKSPRS